MADVIRSSEADLGQSLLERTLTRREVLRGTLLAGGAAFLAACGTSTASPSSSPSSAASAAASASAAPASPSPVPSESWAGVTLQNFTGGYMIPWLDAGTAAWKRYLPGRRRPYPK